MPAVIGWTVDRGILQEDRTAIWWGGLALLGLGAVEAAGAALRHRMACTVSMTGCGFRRGRSWLGRPATPTPWCVTDNDEVRALADQVVAIRSGGLIAASP